jgi:hypothetical protein
MVCVEKPMSKLNRRRRIPSEAREFFLKAFSEQAEETLYPDLYTKLLDEGTDRVVELFKQTAQDRKKAAAKFREKIPLQGAEQAEELAAKTTIGTDAGNNGCDLRFAYLPLYGSVAVPIRNWSIFEDPLCVPGKPEIWPDEPQPRRRESLLTFKVQFEATVNAIDRWNPDYVLFDGPLILNSRFRQWNATKGYTKDFEESLVTALRMLSLSYERDIPLIGFVKRTRSTYYCKQLGVRQIFRDTAFLSPILRIGEYTPAYRRRGSMANLYVDRAEKIGLPQKAAEIHSYYVRTATAPPYRVELPAYCLDRIQELSCLLLTMAEENGIPYPIYEANQYTRMSRKTSNIRALMVLSKALDLVNKGELKGSDLDMLALQHGEPWALYESEFWEQVSGGE